MFGFNKKNNDHDLNSDRLYNWEETFEIYGEKFEVRACYMGHYLYQFIVYNEDNKPVANTSVRFERVPNVDEFVEEIAKPNIAKLKNYIISNYIPNTFNGLDASMIHKKSEEKETNNKDILKNKWELFVTDRIRKAVDKGEYTVNILHNNTMSGDNVFEGGFDKQLMLVETPKILQEKGFNIHIRTNEADPTIFVMTISW